MTEKTKFRRHLQKLGIKDEPVITDEFFAEMATDMEEQKNRLKPIDPTKPVGYYIPSWTTRFTRIKDGKIFQHTFNCDKIIKEHQI